MLDITADPTMVGVISVFIAGAAVCLKRVMSAFKKNFKFVISRDEKGFVAWFRLRRNK